MVTDVYIKMVGDQFQMSCWIDGDLYRSLPRHSPNGAVCDIAVQFSERNNVIDAPKELWALFNLSV